MLWLDGNNIFQIHGDLLTLPSLEDLGIAHNKLQSLPDFRRSVSSSKMRKELIIHVEGNPWYCDQTLDWVRHGIDYENFMEFRKFQLEDITRMTCQGPPNMNGNILWDTSKCKHGLLYQKNYSDVIMSTMASQITGFSIVNSIVCSGADKKQLRVTGFCERNPPVAGGFT